MTFAIKYKINLNVFCYFNLNTKIIYLGGNYNKAEFEENPDLYVSKFASEVKFKKN